MKPTFLTAEWRHLIMANYILDPEILKPHLPKGTELDFFNGKCYASMVGFMFLNTRIKGVKIPFHVNFEEVNLRFYVKRRTGDDWRRGVVFIKEIVPKPAIAWTARLLYREKYVYHPMSHEVNWDNSYNAAYHWKYKGKWQSLSATAALKGNPVRQDSEEMFITEHYYGYSAYSQEKTKEYHVDHPRWNVHKVTNYQLDADISSLYGPEFRECISGKPASVFLLDGSEAKILNGEFI
ncbi:YqjF family protein [Roseivirga sp. BDSF3-8]|uniref:YqjF family protein n=1 Tax=Roseivirga sp. BDSF3-8 TaxID=3241598 RepID=UPI003532478C